MVGCRSTNESGLLGSYKQAVFRFSHAATGRLNPLFSPMSNIQVGCPQAGSDWPTVAGPRTVTVSALQTEPTAHKKPFIYDR